MSQISCVNCRDGLQGRCIGCLRYNIVRAAEWLSREEEEQLLQMLIEVIKQRKANDYGKEDIPSLQEVWAKIENR